MTKSGVFSQHWKTKTFSQHMGTKASNRHLSGNSLPFTYMLSYTELFAFLLSLMLASHRLV